MSQNILHVINSINPKYGGPPSCVRNLAEGFVQLNQEVSILTCDAPQEAFLKNFSKKISVFAVGPAYLKYHYCPKLPHWLRNNIHNYDRVIIHGIWQFHGLATYLAIKNSGVPYYLFTHGMLDPYFKRAYPFKHIKKSIYWHIAERHIINNARGVLFTSNTEKKQSPLSFPLYNVNGVVVDYGVNPPPDNVSEQISTWEKKYPNIVGKKYLIFMGRVHEKKGIDLTIRAFEELAESDSQIHLVIAGPWQAGYVDQLKVGINNFDAQISSRIIWTGMLEGDEKWGALRGAEAFVLHSHQENFGIAVAEALACGVPVLVSDKVNICDEIKNAKAGIVSDDTIEGSRNSLMTWAKFDRQTKAEYSHNAKKLFEEKYNITKNIKSILDVILQ